MFKAAVFDLDGTLLNTLKDLAAAGNYSLAARGFVTHEINVYKRFIGSGTYQLAKRALPPAYRENDDLVRAVHADMCDYYSRHLMDETQPYEGVVPLLRQLRQRGVLVGVLTNKPDGNAKMLAEKLLPGLTDRVHGQREGFPTKPDPSGLFEILEYFHETPEHCIYVGDSTIDLETGTNAGVRTIGVSWGFAPRSALTAAGEFVIVDKVEDLTALLIDNR